ncbi:glycosyltransferase [Flavihumibacter sp. R14]|nr:glycosyltransferase [Flavihumibacter soli]
MKHKIFFVVSSFKAGGSERVFWLLCQAFDKSKFDITVVLLNSQNNAFSLNVLGVRIIDLKTIKASRSFIPLLKLFKAEKPYAVYSTGGQINMLVATVSVFCSIPHLIGRSTNIPHERKKYAGFKSRALSLLEIFVYRNFDYLVCQSKEMLASWASKSFINSKKLVMIGNPVLQPDIIRSTELREVMIKLIIVGKMSSVKGHDRLIEIFRELPDNYHLTIAGGDGGTENLVKQRIRELNLCSRVTMIGQISNVCEQIARHRIFLLTSYSEGFPNVILEALSVGTPVVTFRVGGVSDFIIDDFNGYIVEQGDIAKFRDSIVKASEKLWDHKAISADIQKRFSVSQIVKQYEQLIVD